MGRVRCRGVPERRPHRQRLHVRRQRRGAVDEGASLFEGSGTITIAEPSIFCGNTPADLYPPGGIDGSGSCFATSCNDANGNRVPDECDADLTGDGLVGVDDLLAMFAVWGVCPGPCPPSCPGDINGDCAVGVDDFLVLLASWG